MKNFKEKLEKAMEQLNLNRQQVVGLTGKSKASISMYLNGKTIPSEKVQSDIAVSLGLDRDYFQKEDAPTATKKKPVDNAIHQIKVENVAKLMHLNHNTIRLGLQQGVFPWGYAVHTSTNRWVYFINADRFAEIEKISIPAEMVV